MASVLHSREAQFLLNLPVRYELVRCELLPGLEFVLWDDTDVSGGIMRYKMQPPGLELAEFRFISSGVICPDVTQSISGPSKRLHLQAGIRQMDGN